MGLLSFLFGSKPEQPKPQSGGLLGGGSAQAYRDYVIDTQTQGKQPLSFADWQKMQAQQAQKAPPPKQ